MTIEEQILDALEYGDIIDANYLAAALGMVKCEPIPEFKECLLNLLRQEKIRLYPGYKIRLK